MASVIIKSILDRINHPELVSVLAEQLSGSELNSVLLEVFNARTQALNPPAMLNLYQQNRFAKPADLPPLEMKRMELEVLQLFTQYAFLPLDLAPVTVLGACSVVGPADQKKVLSALRGTEVLADSTNAIALHVCDLKQRNMLTNDVTRFSNIHRMVRTQAVTGKGFTPHFRVGCLVTCGLDTGGFNFEMAALHEHIQVMKALFLEYFKMEKVGFRILRRQGYPADFFRDVINHITKHNAGTEITAVEQPEKDIAYYKGVQYKVDILCNGKTYEIGDGGFVDWTQQLLQNKKERMFSTGFGFDLMYRILHDKF